MRIIEPEFVLRHRFKSIFHGLFGPGSCQDLHFSKNNAFPCGFVHSHWSPFFQEAAFAYDMVRHCDLKCVNNIVSESALRSSTLPWFVYPCGQHLFVDGVGTVSVGVANVSEVLSAIMKSSMGGISQKVSLFSSFATLKVFQICHGKIPRLGSPQKHVEGGRGVDNVFDVLDDVLDVLVNVFAMKNRNDTEPSATMLCQCRSFVKCMFTLPSLKRIFWGFQLGCDPLR